MVELVSLRTADGMSRVINLDHVVHIQDIPSKNSECSILLSNGEKIVAEMSASQFSRLPRLTPGTRGL
jgi:hypothetical protein